MIYSKYYRICLFLLILVIVMPFIEGYTLNYQSFSYQINSESIKETAVISSHNNKSVECSLFFAGSSFYESYYNNFDPSNLEVKINNEQVEYVKQSKDDFLGANGFYTIINSCNQEFMQNISKCSKDFIDFSELCKKNEISNISLYMASTTNSTDCNFEITVKNRDFGNNIEKSFLSQKFKTAWIPTDNSSLIMEIIVPDNYIIKNYNLPEYVKELKTNSIKWVLDNQSKDRVQFTLEYNLPLSVWIVNNITENIYIVIFEFFFTIIGIIATIYGFYKFIKGKKWNHIKFLKRKLNEIIPK